MAGRIRTVKPEWLDDEKLVLASPAARVLTIALILLADDHGRGRANPALIVSRIFPGHSRQGKEAFQELREMGFFRLYRVRGQTYFEIPNWTKHQRVDKPGKPRVPEPCEADEKILENFPESLAKDSESLATDHDHDHDLDHDHIRSTSAASRPVFDFESVYKLYPRKQGKKGGMDSLKRKIKTQSDYDKLHERVSQLAEIWSKATKQQIGFCPYWSTFVSQEQWLDDELPTPPQPTRTAGKSETATDRHLYQDLTSA